MGDRIRPEQPIGFPRNPQAITVGSEWVGHYVGIRTWNTHLVALVRAGATFVDGVKIEREDQRNAA